MLDYNVNAFSQTEIYNIFQLLYFLVFIFVTDFPPTIMAIGKSMFEKRGRLHSKGNDPEQSVSPAKIKQERNYF